MQIFVKNEYDYVEGEMSVGMLAKPLTLSAAALSWIPWLNFNGCSTMRIRQGDLVVLFLSVVRYACIMRMSLGMFAFYVVCKCMHIFLYLCVFLPAVCMCLHG